MRKVRNAVIILILCLIGGYEAYKPQQNHPGLPPMDVLRDALAGNPVNASRPGLHFTNSDDDQLHDSVAANAVPGFHNNNGPHGDTEDGTPPPPRGGGNGGIGSFSGPNPGSQLPPSGPNLSPSGPVSPFSPPQ